MRSILPLGYFGMMHLNLDYFSLSFLHNNNQGQGTQSKTSGCHRVIIYECKRLRRMLFFFSKKSPNKTTHFWGPPDWLRDWLVSNRKSPPKPYFEILYLDHDLRVHKTGQGNVFVQEPKKHDAFSEKRQMCHVIIVGGFPVLPTKTKLGTQIQFSTIQWNETLSSFLGIEKHGLKT